jgi:Fe-S-cluster containining protein
MMKTSNDEETLKQTSIATANRRTASALAALDPDLEQRDDDFAKKMRATNASVKAKLGALYKLTELSATLAPHIACKMGCADCCRMSVCISDKEARVIGAATGRVPAAIASTLRYPERAFSGTPCPFLQDSRCTIYPIRPYLCRTHFSFDTSAYWCAPDRAYSVELDSVRFGGIDNAYADITGGLSDGIFADIRDFFPLP